MRHYLRTFTTSLAAAAIVATLPLGAASEKIDYEAITKIKEPGPVAGRGGTGGQ